MLSPTRVNFVCAAEDKPAGSCDGCAFVGLGRWSADVRGVELVALQAAPVIVTLP